MKARVIALAVALMAAFAAGPALPQDGPGTSEFQVNTATEGFPTYSSVAQRPQGDFVVVWTVLGEVDYPSGPFPLGIFGRRFDPAGRALGAEFQISDAAMDYNYGPVTAMADDGSFVVVWNDFDSTNGVRASRFAADGTALVEETRLTDRGRYAAVAGDAQGNWLALWDDRQQVRGRRFDAAAEVWEPETQISPGTGHQVSHPTVAGNGRGDLVAAWLQLSTPPTPESRLAILALRLASTGEVRGEALQVNETPPTFLRPAVDVDEDGGFVIAFGHDGGVSIRRFDATGTPFGGELLVTALADRFTSPALTLDDAGELLVAWLGVPPGHRPPYALMGRRFDSLGVPRGGEFPLTFLPGDYRVPPALASSDPEGRLVVTYRAGHELYGRLLPADLRAGVLQLADDPGAPFSEVAEERATRAVRVLRTGGYGPLTVEYFTADGAASLPGAPAATAGEDYAAVSGTLVFADDEIVKTFPLTIYEDDDPESNELLTVGLRHPTDGALLGTPAVAAVVVYDDDPVAPGEGLAPRGPELRVNATRAGEQRYPRVAVNGGGDFLVVWQGRGGDDWDVFGRLFGADGKARGPDLPLADETAGDQTRPALAAAPDGSFVVSWIREDLTVHGRRVAPSGAAAPSLGAELPLGVCGGYCGLLLGTDVAVDGDGRFVVVWNGRSTFSSYYYTPVPVVQGQRFAPGGQPLGEGLSLAGAADPAAVSTAPSGEFIVVWSRFGSEELIGRRWDADGALAEFFTLDDVPGASHPDVVRLPGGDALVFWQGREPADPADSLVSSKALDVYGRRFSARGAPRGERFLLNGFRPGVQSEPRVAASPAGEHVVVWTSRDELGPGRSDVLARRFAADGERLGGRIPVNPSPFPKSSPDVAMDAAGNFVVVWESAAGDGDFDVFAQRFSGAACVAGQRALCLQEGRFRVEIEWRDFGGVQGRAFARPLTDDTGAFWFFGENNLEVMVKVLDGRALNGHFWVFYGSLSNVEFEIAVTDAVTGRRKTYVNPLGHFASAGDVVAFPGE